MSNRLQNFVDEHPEFFQETNGYWRLNSDIKELMDGYARAYDSEEYDRLRILVEEARALERDRLQLEIDEWTRDCAREQEKAEQIELQLQTVVKGLIESERRFEQAKEASKPGPVPQKSWYHSGAVFMALAFSGLSFIYLAIILNDRISMSYLISGLCCLAAGIYLQSGGPKVQLDSSGTAAINAGIIKEEQNFLRIARIKRATLVERKRIANQTMATFNRKIKRSIAKLDTLDD